MRSFIFNFRALVLAAALIGLIEGACALALRPVFVERANVGLLDLFHNSAIFGKLAAFAHSSPDLIQIGDSSGFHGVRPEVVMRHLGGLKYVNLSCCAGMGYRGYYAAADFMLRRNPGIKAVVLYVSLNNLPREELILGTNRMGEYMADSLTTPFAYLAPPTLALRQRIADRVKAGRLPRNEAVFVADMRESTHRHYGWWAEHDRRLAAPKRAEYWRGICGQTGVAVRNDADIDYGTDFLHGRRSYMRTELQGLASLAAGYGAKLVLAFHPYSCRGIEGSYLPARREDLRALLRQNSNMVALPEQMFVPWPTERFVGPDHLHVGYDEENSHRLGQLLAPVLGMRSAGASPAPELAAPTAEASAPARLVNVQWRSDGALVAPDRGAGEGPGSHRLIETAGRGAHRAEATLAGLTPGGTAVLSFSARPTGARGILVELQNGAHLGGGFCDLVGKTATRERDMLDVGIDVEADGWSRCWIAMTVREPGATLRLSLTDERLDPTYLGDGTSGVAVRGIELRETKRFLSGESSPW